MKTTSKTTSMADLLELTAKSSRVTKSTRIEDMIFDEIKEADSASQELEARYKGRLASFPDLLHDVFQCLYSLDVRFHDQDDLTLSSRQINWKLIEHMTASSQYAAVRCACGGNPIASFRAAAAFAAEVMEHLEKICTNVKRNPLTVLQDMEKRISELADQMSDESGRHSESDQYRLDSLCRQAEMVAADLKETVMKNSALFEQTSQNAAESCTEEAVRANAVLASWGNDPGNPETHKLNLELLDSVRQSDTLVSIAVHLGRFKEVLKSRHTNSSTFAYDRGEIFDIESGRDISRLLSAEFAPLAVPEAVPLFLDKYRRGKLLQYSRRDPQDKIKGDIIVCLDESGSARQDADWGKALALTFLDIARIGRRNFALIHFSADVKTDLFLTDQYTTEDVMKSCTTFLGGGTDFEKPLREAVRLISDEDQKFKDADIVFITDGECRISDEFSELLAESQKKHKFQVTGVLLDKSKPGFSFSISEFCRHVYRTSELVDQQIVHGLINERI